MSLGLGSAPNRRFDTDVPDLEDMCEWLEREAVTHVVMESTGSYWIPVFNIFEGALHHRIGES